MKRSKLIVSLMIAVAVSSTGALVLTGCSSGVPGRGGGRQSGEARPPSGPSVYKIMYQLELAEEQIPGVRAVLEDAEEKRGALIAGSNSRPDPSMMQTQMGAIDRETESQLTVILTAEQMERYREMMEEAWEERERMRSDTGSRRRGRGGGGGKRGGR